MQRVVVRGADGKRRLLAFVRKSGTVIYVCAERHFKDAQKGDDSFVVGFPEEAVEVANNLELAN